jgi:hypothetical protein
MSFTRWVLHGLRVAAVFAIVLGMVRMSMAASGTGGCSLSVRRIKGPPVGATYLHAACNTDLECDTDEHAYCQAHVGSPPNEGFISCRCPWGSFPFYCLEAFKPATPPVNVFVDGNPYVGGESKCVNHTCPLNCASDSWTDANPPTSPQSQDLNCECPGGS